jgi:hypothetical protein
VSTVLEERPVETREDLGDRLAHLVDWKRMAPNEYPVYALCGKKLKGIPAPHLPHCLVCDDLAGIKR